MTLHISVWCAVFSKVPDSLLTMNEELHHNLKFTYSTEAYYSLALSFPLCGPTIKPRTSQALLYLNSSSNCKTNPPIESRYWLWHMMNLWRNAWTNERQRQRNVFKSKRGSNKMIGLWKSCVNVLLDWCDQLISGWYISWRPWMMTTSGNNKWACTMSAGW